MCICKVLGTEELKEMTLTFFLPHLKPVCLSSPNHTTQEVTIENRLRIHFSRFYKSFFKICF